MKCLFFSGTNRKPVATEAHHDHLQSDTATTTTTPDRKALSWNSIFFFLSTTTNSSCRKPDRDLVASSSSQPHTTDRHENRRKAYSSPASLTTNASVKEPLMLKNGELNDHQDVSKNPDNEAPVPSISNTRDLKRVSEPLSLTYAELRAATREFSKELGEGGFGRVYYGQLRLNILSGNLPDFGVVDVAVKKLNVNGQQGHKEWLAEVHFLGVVEHPNLVKLVGYCAEDDERGIQRLLVYEFMENGSLEDHLFRRKLSPLTWKMRLNILLGAAQGLAYLHEEIDGIQVIFRDFKTANVLLDKKFNPKLSDFGLARQGPGTGASHVSTSVLGTMGYAAPEYIQTGHLTSKSDVWSFGVVLLEILSGRISLDPNRPRHEQNLVEWARPFLVGNRKINYMMDPKLVGKYSLVQAEKALRLALECLNRYPRERPTMSAIVQKLKDIISLSDSDDASFGMQPKVEDIKEPIRLKRRQHCFRDVKNITWISQALQT